MPGPPLATTAMFARPDVAAPATRFGEHRVAAAPAAKVAAPAKKVIGPAKHMEFIGYLPLWLSLLGSGMYVLKLHGAPGSSPGQLVWLDFRCWYFTLYNDPFEGPHRYWQRHYGDWIEDTRIKHGLDNQRKAKVSLRSAWEIAAQLFSARTLPQAGRQNMLRWATHLWSLLAVSGTFDIGCAWHLQVRGGCVNAELTAALLFIEANKRNAFLTQLRTYEILLSTCPVPLFSFVLRRFCSLNKLHTILEVALTLDTLCTQLVEAALLNSHRHLLVPEAPPGKASKLSRLFFSG